MRIELDNNYPLPPQLSDPAITRRIMKLAYAALRNGKLSAPGEFSEDVLFATVAGLYAKMDIIEDIEDPYEFCSTLYDVAPVQEGDATPCGEIWSATNNPVIVYAQAYAPRSAPGYAIELGSNGQIDIVEDNVVRGILNFRPYSGLPRSVEKAQTRLTRVGIPYLAYYNTPGDNVFLESLWDLCGYSEPPYRMPLAVEAYRVIPERFVDLTSGETWEVPVAYQGYPATLIEYPSSLRQYQHVHRNGVDGNIWAVTDLVDYATSPWWAYLTVNVTDYPDEDFPLPDTGSSFEGFEIDLWASARIPDGLPALPLPYTAGLVKVRGARGRLYGLGRDGFAYTRAEGAIEAEISLRKWLDVAVEGDRRLHIYYRLDEGNLWALYQEIYLVDLAIGPVSIEFETGADYYYIITGDTPFQHGLLRSMFRITKIGIG